MQEIESLKKGPRRGFVSPTEKESAKRPQGRREGGAGSLPDLGTLVGQRQSIGKRPPALVRTLGGGTFGMSEPVSPSGSVGVKVGEDAEEEKL